MKRFFNIFLSFIIICSLFIFSGCSKNNENNNTTSNEEYYLTLGYHSITFDKYSNIIYDNSENNKVVISDNKIMLPHNAKFSVSFNTENNVDFTLNNSNYINFSTGKILTSFTDGTKIFDINTNLITLKNNLNISANFENLQVLGVAIFQIIENYTSLPNLSGKFDELPSDQPDLLYYYSKDASYESFANSTSQIVHKTGYLTTATMLENDKFELDICLEIFVDTININAYLILKDETNHYYFYEKPFSDDFINESLIFDNLLGENNNIKKITLSLCYDLSTRDEY